MEGQIAFFPSKDTSGNKPHFRGFLKIEGKDHEFAVWPSKTGVGFSGKYKPKEDRPKEPGPKSTSEEPIPF